MSEQVHWGDETARPTSLHGNGAGSFSHTTLSRDEVTCGLCKYLLHKHDTDEDQP